MSQDTGWTWGFWRKIRFRPFVLTLLGILFLWLCYQVRSVLNPLLVGLMLAYILNPAVEYFTRKLRVPRVAVCAAVFVLMLALIAATIGYGVPALVRQVVAVYDSMVEPETGFIPRTLQGLGIDATGTQAEAAASQAWEEVKRNLQPVLAATGEGLLYLVKFLLATVSGLITLIMWLILVPIYTFFMLLRMHDIWEVIKRHLPGLHRERILHVTGRIGMAVNDFFRGRLILCVTFGIMTYIGLALVGVPFALLLSVIIGVLSIVPFVGTIIGYIPVVLLALFGVGGGIERLVLTLVVYIVTTSLDGWIVTPLILGKTTGLHPVVLIVVIFLGGHLMGFFGMLLAVPLFSTLLILFEEFILPHIRALADEEPLPQKESRQ